MRGAQGTQQADVSVQVNVLNYLQSIISCQATANPVMDSPITPLLVQMLRSPQGGAFQVLLATILGLLVRHCTFIPAALADSGEKPSGKQAAQLQASVKVLSCATQAASSKSAEASTGCMHTIAHPLLDMCWAPDLSKTFQVSSQRTSLPIGICLHSQSEWGRRWAMQSPAMTRRGC